MLHLTGTGAPAGALTTHTRAAGDVDDTPASGAAIAPAAAPATLAACTDTADRLAYLCARTGGHYRRRRNDDGTVFLSLALEGGDVLATTQPTTEACVEKLLTRAGVTE